MTPRDNSAQVVRLCGGVTHPSKSSCAVRDAYYFTVGCVMPRDNSAQVVPVRRRHALFYSRVPSAKR
ncbi:MAG: hypothetical protein KME26_29145 [Oscillatoria princeps RMCB-10]|nr:hypothetical protein [Oscillatoria princeps RMCB-10]